jgi:hypothetical protein
VTFNTLALELVSPNVAHGLRRAGDEARKFLKLSKQFGVDGRIGRVMIPD